MEVAVGVASTQFHLNVLFDFSGVVGRDLIVDLLASVDEWIVGEGLGRVQSDSIISEEFLGVKSGLLQR